MKWFEPVLCVFIIVIVTTLMILAITALLFSLKLFMGVLA